MKPALIKVLEGKRLDPPPIWIMRQAGRYLPEYRELRTRAGSFLDFCYAPAMAAAATLQPLRRFDLDAAIIFSDILVVPDALGRKVWFVEGEGPRLEPLTAEEKWTFAEPPRRAAKLAPVYEAIERVRAALPRDKALLGFCGGPWTMATYMLTGAGGNRDAARRIAYERPAEVDALLETLADAAATHLAAQVAAGADAVQVFESWAEGLPTDLFTRLIVRPVKRLVAAARAAGVTCPIIGFPRGAGVHLPLFARETRVSALGLDTAVPPQWARAQVGPALPLQGNLDPQALLAGGAALAAAVRQSLKDFAGGPHVFNLGHGITPEAKLENVAELIRLVRGG
jgi:uroporphyrinogen decarboxylase